MHVKHWYIINAWYIKIITFVSNIKRFVFDNLMYACCPWEIIYIFPFICKTIPVEMISFTIITHACMHAQSWPTLSSHMDCSSPGSSVHGIFQARTLEQIAISFSERSSQSKDQAQPSWISRWILNHCATFEALISHTWCMLSCSVVSDSLWPHGL